MLWFLYEGCFAMDSAGSLCVCCGVGVLVWFLRRVDMLTMGGLCWELAMFVRLGCCHECLWQQVGVSMCGVHDVYGSVGACACAYVQRIVFCVSVRLVPAITSVLVLCPWECDIWSCSCGGDTAKCMG